jgi:hypothetical protein
VPKVPKVKKNGAGGTGKDLKKSSDRIYRIDRIKVSDQHIKALRAAFG